MNQQFDGDYWNERWKNGETGWDIGYASPALMEFAKRLPKDANILIPGCGNAYEAESLYKQGFKNIYIMDISPLATASFHARFPEFPASQILCQDFFEPHPQLWDVVIEQTFFCALDPAMRSRYAEQMGNVIKTGGVLAGLLFNIDFGNPHPPFGGNKAEYETLFANHFIIETMEPCANSIGPRAGKELWFELRRK
jgi:thiopurine S-methyltransferase